MTELIGRYLPLFKIRICSLITFSAITGYVSVGPVSKASLYRVVFLVISTMLAAMAASAMNHYFESDIDGVMDRTSARPLAGKERPAGVPVVAGVLFLISAAIALWAFNWMVAIHLALGAFVYVVLYTVWLKRRSWVNIVIGGLAGSFAVLAGGASASPEWCMPPVVLAVVMFFWTPSHFWSFAMLHREDYARAGVPMLPVVIGDNKTAVYIFVNTVLLVISSLIPFFLGYSGWIYLAGAVVAGAYFLWQNIRLLKNVNVAILRKNFNASMVYLGVLFMALIIDSAL